MRLGRGPTTRPFSSRPALEARKDGSQDQETAVHSSFPQGRRLCHEHGHTQASAVPMSRGPPCPGPLHPLTAGQLIFPWGQVPLQVLSDFSGISRGGNDNPLQYSCLENPMDRRVWWAMVHGGRKESDTTERLHFSIHINIFVVALLSPSWF